MHFVRRGSGAPTLVFVHGFACTHEDWLSQLEFFSARHETLACDLRAHGATPGRPQECSIEHYGGDVAALVANLQLEKCVLVGHSMGCRVVLEANRLIADKVAALVLVDGSRLAEGDAEGAQAAALAAIDRVGYPAFAENLFRQMFFTPSPAAEAIVRRAVTGSARFGRELWSRMARWDAGSMDAAFAAVRSPLLVIQSTTRDASLRRSPLQAGQSSPWLEYARNRGARVEVLPDTGHFPQIERPEALNRLIAAFPALT
ncbi:MAG TPA: alpha/beta hydrolase [Burkholderiales bacterium]|nr:alpha/beta hydrolase [Burkholderiales bacterium]